MCACMWDTHTHTDGERAQKGEKETKKLSDFKRVRSTGKKKGVCFYVFVGLWCVHVSVCVCMCVRHPAELSGNPLTSWSLSSGCSGSSSSSPSSPPFTLLAAFPTRLICLLLPLLLLFFFFFSLLAFCQLLLHFFFISFSSSSSSVSIFLFQLQLGEAKHGTLRKTEKHIWEFASVEPETRLSVNMLL